MLTPGALMSAVAAAILCANWTGPRDIILPAAVALLRHRWFIIECLKSGTWIPLSAWRTTGGTVGALMLVQLLRHAWTTSDRYKWKGPGSPMVFPARTVHTRLFPKHHSFSYPYLVVGIPVGWEGSAGGLVSAGVREITSLWSWLFTWSVQRTAWYHVEADDHLERGDNHLGLRGKLDKYLLSQGHVPAVYPYAYLITQPRFLGYVFNPVSFWYLYSLDRSLAAMILEVNNTFDERRMYFLEPEAKSHELLGTRRVREDTANLPRVFKQSWPKDFHVSPFNSRKGSYSISANDPLAPGMHGKGPIDITISLISSKKHAKLVTRLFTEEPALDPVTITLRQKILFVCSWSWVGFLTFPRIVKEAGALFFKRKLHVWFRPEPLRSTIGRQPDAAELQLEHVFKRYLRHLVDQCDIPLAVKYNPSWGPGSLGELMLSPSAGEQSRETEPDVAIIVEELEFKVLTPVFYSRFLHYAHDLEALFCELNESCTIWISRPELLPKLFFKTPPLPLRTSHLLDFAYFKAIQGLRRRPERIARPLTSASAALRPGQRQTPGGGSTSASNSAGAVDIRDFRISSMDGYMLSHGDVRLKRTYRSAVLRQFVADRIALGSTALLETGRLLIQACAAWVILSSLPWHAEPKVSAAGDARF